METVTPSLGNRERIVEAAAELLHGEGPGALTTRRVAHEAGVQAPAIYRLFGDKDGLLEAVAEHVMSRYASAKAAVVSAAADGGVDPVADLRAGWAGQVAFGLGNPTLFRLLSDPDRVRSSPAARRGRSVLETRVRRIAETGRLRVSEKRAVDLIAAAGVGAITTLLAEEPETRDVGVADALFDAVLSRILSPEPAESYGEAVTTALIAAVAFRARADELAALSDAERGLMTEWLDRAIAAEQS